MTYTELKVIQYLLLIQQPHARFAGTIALP